VCEVPDIQGPMSTVSQAPASRFSDRTFYVFTGVVSAAALSLLAWLLLIRRGGAEGVDLRFMPAVNASLNALSASLLLAGWVAIRRGARRLHQYLMVSTFAASSLFLVGYLAYHYVHGDTKYAGDGAMRAVYLLILASHVLLSMPVVPLALVAFYFAWRQDFRRHRKVTRWLAPIWLYVSVTGVVVYFLLRGSLPASP
jgi:putative membrane protein